MKRPLLAASGIGELWYGTVKLLSRATTMEELQILAIKYTIPGLTRIWWEARILYGSALEWKLVFEAITKWWTITPRANWIIEAIAQDWIKKMVYRTVSTSTIEGHTVSSTIEVGKIVLWKFVPFSPWEIKFILPNVFTP